MMFSNYDKTRSWSPQQREKGRRELEQKKYYEGISDYEAERLKDIKAEMKRKGEEYDRI